MASKDPAILRAVARAASAEARTAIDAAGLNPTADLLRAAYRACVFAARALRRGSISQTADDETAMIEASIRFDEEGYGLRRRLLADLIDPPTA